MNRMRRKQWDQLMAKAQAGNSEAQWEVGSWFHDGLADLKGKTLVHPDARAAVGWFCKSAIAGNCSGQNHLGVCLCAGRGIRKDDAEALRWFKRAFRRNYPCAANNIASVYQDRRNHRRAMFWYSRAAASGDGDALVEVGRCYYRGLGTKRDPNHAVLCFRKAIASKSISPAGREDAMFHLGVAFHEGRGVKQSSRQALKWLSEANQDDDHPEACKLIEKISRRDLA
jgi:TPR repeat protein